MDRGHTEVRVALGEVSLSPAQRGWWRLPWVAGAVGAAALAGGWAVGAGGDPRRLLAAYLVAWLFALTLALGGLFFVLLHYLTRAGWSVVVRRLAEHVAATMPLVAVLFVPIGLGLSTLYPWAAPGAAEHDALLAGKSGWLQPSFFLLRSAVYLVVWSALAGWLRRRSVAQDAAAAPAVARRLQTASAPAMVLYAVTVTFAAFDWVMSLDPHWYSTIFGVYLFSGCVVAIYAALALLAMALQRSGALGGEMVNAEHYHDMGKLLFGFVVFWAYIAFSQYLLIWYGNIPEETAWFAHRLEHGWQAASIALALGHFVLPFFFLLPRQVKRRRPLLATAAVWLLALHWLDLYWLVVPTVPGASPAPGAADALLGLGTAALWLAAFAALARRPALLPVHDPRLAESLSFENV